MPQQFVPDPAGMRAMLGTPDMVGVMEQVCEPIVIRAEEIAPVVTGAYAFGIESADGGTDGGFDINSGLHDGIAYGRVTNSVRSKPSAKWPQGYPYGVALEFGNARIKAQRILGRALDELNLSRRQPRRNKSRHTRGIR
jgi:hypothetical protein